MPNCLAIFEGLTPALKAARTALNFPGVNETGAASSGRLLGVFSCEGGFLPRRCCSAVTAAISCSSSWSLRCLIAAGKSLGKTYRDDEAALSAAGAGGLGGSKDDSRGNTVEKRLGIIESFRPLPIMAIMPLSHYRGNGLRMPAGADPLRSRGKNDANFSLFQQVCAFTSLPKTRKQLGRGLISTQPNSD